MAEAQTNGLHRFVYMTYPYLLLSAIGFFTWVVAQIHSLHLQSQTLQDNKIDRKEYEMRMANLETNITKMSGENRDILNQILKQTKP